MKDHVRALVDAVDRGDDAAAKVASVALGCAAADLIERAVVALESIAANTAPVKISGSTTGGGLGEN